MYFPLLRAKQFELLAVREVSPIISNKLVSPIIEPTKADTTQLVKAVNTFVINNINFTLILNSCIVNVGCMDSISELIKSYLKTYSNFQIGINVTESLDFEKLSEFIEINHLEEYAYSLIHLQKPKDLNVMNNFIRDYNVKYNIIHIENVKSRYKRNFDAETCVSMNDSFNQQQRNADYISYPDELFSEEFLYYKDEGFIGFCDYLTIGERFSDSGFTPYVVVIHLTYLKGKEIRIAHFSSKSKKDTNSPLDLPKKFEEALDALLSFVDSNSISLTRAIKEFQNLKAREHFPGLGTIKKLSIMNHLELVSNLI